MCGWPLLIFVREEDVSQTLYKDTLKISKSESAVVAQLNGQQLPSLPGAARKDNKVNVICDAFLAVLKDRVDTNLQNLVTAHVCKSPPDLEAGLSLVAHLRSMSGSLEHSRISTANTLIQHEIANKPRMPLNTCAS